MAAQWTVQEKKRCGGSVRASAYLWPPAEDGWPFRVSASSNAMPLGKPWARGGPGYPALLFPLALPWAVNAGRRGRRPLRDGVRERPVCPGHCHPCRGGCPHPPALPSPHLPPSKAQANLKESSFRQTPRGLYQTHIRGTRPTQGSGLARTGRRPPCFCQNRFGRPPY